MIDFILIFYRLKKWATNTVVMFSVTKILFQYFGTNAET